jgi:hypothetical protein
MIECNLNEKEKSDIDRILGLIKELKKTQDPE